MEKVSALWRCLLLEIPPWNEQFARSSLIYNTCARHERHECDTSATQAAWVQHDWDTRDTSVTRVLHERHEYDSCRTRVVRVALVSNSLRSCTTRIALASQSCRLFPTRVALVSLVSLLSGTRAVNFTRSSLLLLNWKTDIFYAFSILHSRWFEKKTSNSLFSFQKHKSSKIIVISDKTGFYWILLSILQSFCSGSRHLRTSPLSCRAL